MKNKKGFTLVELLAVIVILGVLLLVAVPAITGVQTKSKQNAAKDGALMFVKAIETCAMMENGGVCSSTNLATYYEGTVSNTTCGNTADCAYYSYDATNKTVTVQYSLSGYGFDVTKSTLTEVRKSISKTNAGDLLNDALHQGTA